MFECNRTTPTELKNIACKLMSEALESKTVVQVELDKHISNRVVVRVTFFGNENMIFFMDLYEFCSKETNEKIADLAIKLMKNPDKWNEIEIKIKELQ